MKSIIQTLFLYIFFSTVNLYGAESLIERHDWLETFNKEKLKGSIVVADWRNNNKTILVYNQKRSKTRFSPASTFKIPHTLFALDAGIVADEFQVFKWDGVKRPHLPSNRDQTLRSSMQNSVVWVYKRFAKELGKKSEQDYLTKINYGNTKSTGRKAFWIKGDLSISGIEQLIFFAETIPE